MLVNVDVCELEVITSESNDYDFFVAIFWYY